MKTFVIVLLGFSVIVALSEAAAIPGLFVKDSDNPHPLVFVEAASHESDEERLRIPRSPGHNPRHGNVPVNPGFGSGSSSKSSSGSQSESFTNGFGGSKSSSHSESSSSSFSSGRGGSGSKSQSSASSQSSSGGRSGKHGSNSGSSSQAKSQSGSSSHGK